jgi:hypothetical protein
MRTVIAAILVSFTSCAFAFTCRAEEIRAVVILDATAQMGGNLGQKRKLDWAKTGISGATSRMDPGAAFALWAFGSSPQKKCEDINELVPLQAAGGALRTLDKALSTLQPKAARAPAMDALQAALKSVGARDGKAVSAILVAGTGDDCIGDICGAAGRLHGLYPKARLTVLGVNMGEQPAVNFTCAAKAMGGAFIGVKSGADLERNLREALGSGQMAPGQQKVAVVTPTNDAVGGTQTDAPEAPAAPASAPPPADQPAEKEAEEKFVPPPQLEPNVVLSAALVPGMPPLEAGVTWEIYKIQVTPTGQIRLAEAPLWVGGGGQAKAKLPEGRYSARVAYGLATGTGEFTLGTEKVDKTIALDAGTIVAEAQQAPNGPPVGDAFFVVTQKTSVGREELGRSSGAPALFHLNAGDYVLSAFAGSATLEASVRVVAGKVSVVRIPLNLGTLEIKAFAKDGSPDLVAAWYRLSPAVSDPKSGGLPVFRISGSSPRLQLPAGSYRLETVYGNAREDSMVTVKAGLLTSQNVILNAGEAKLSLPPGKSDKVCVVYEAGADRKAAPIGRAAGSDIRFILKAGRYDVECSGKSENAPPKQTQISVVAGEVQSAKIQE